MVNSLRKCPRLMSHTWDLCMCVPWKKELCRRTVVGIKTLFISKNVLEYSGLFRWIQCNQMAPRIWDVPWCLCACARALSLSFSPLPSLLPPFYNRVLPQSPNWSQIYKPPPPALVFQILGLQVCVTTPCSYLCFLKDLLGGILKDKLRSQGQSPVVKHLSSIH